MYNILRLLLLALAVLQAGCISYSQKKITAVSEWPVKTTEKKQSAMLNLVIETQFNGSKKMQEREAHLKIQKIIESNYRESNLFTSVNLGRNTSGINIDIAFVNDTKENPGMSFLGRLSLFIIPIKIDNVLTMKTIFRNSQRQVIGKIEKTETVTTWMQILLIFGMPFNISLDEVIANMTRHTLNEALEKGYLNPAAQPL